MNITVDLLNRLRSAPLPAPGLVSSLYLYRYALTDHRALVRVKDEVVLLGGSDVFMADHLRRALHRDTAVHHTLDEGALELLRLNRPAKGRQPGLLKDEAQAAGRYVV